MPGRAGAVLYLGAMIVYALSSSEQVQATYLQRCSKQDLRGHLERAPDPSGEFVTHFPRGFSLDCPVEKRRVIADSARHYATQQRLELMGHVRYTEGGTSITANRMEYTRRDDMVWASDNVHAQMPSGSTVTGHSIKYWAEKSAAYPTGRMEAENRPTFLIVQIDTVRSQVDPTKSTITADQTKVVAEKIISQGDEVFASQQVVITRADIEATSDSLYGNQKEDARVMKLMGKPEVKGKGRDPFTVKGNRIDIDAGEDKKIRRMQAIGNGDFSSKDFSLASDTVDMHLSEEKINKALAMGDSGATMRHKENTMVGHRLEILMPGGNLGEIKSFGSALAELVPDTMQVKTKEKNFVKGDTVLITFERILNKPPAPAPRPAPPAGNVVRDTSRRDTIVVAAAQGTTPTDSTDSPRKITAIGNASIFFQSAPGRGNPDCPTIDYWTGSRIDVELADGKPKSMEILHGPSGFVQGLNSECGNRRGGAAGRSGAGGTGRAGGRGGAGTDTTLAAQRIPRE